MQAFCNTRSDFYMEKTGIIHCDNSSQRYFQGISATEKR